MKSQDEGENKDLKRRLKNLTNIIKRMPNVEVIDRKEEILLVSDDKQKEHTFLVMIVPKSGIRKSWGVPFVATA